MQVQREVVRKHNEETTKRVSLKILVRHKCESGRDL